MQIKCYVAKTGKFQFVAAVSYNGEWLKSDTTGRRSTAVKNLQAKLTALGVSPLNYTFDVQDMGDVSQNETPTTPASPPVPEEQDPPTLKQLPDFSEEDPADIAGEAIEKAQVEITPRVAPRMQGGLVTPLSDKKAWTDVFRQAREKFDGVEFPGESKGERVRNYRDAIGLVMRGVSFVGPWDRTPGGDFWIRFSAEQDHTVKQARAGDGRRREQHHKDINGVYTNVASKKRGKKGSSSGSGATSEQKKVAHNYGRSLQKTAPDNKTGVLWYKLGYVASLRSQGAVPHTKFEKDLVDAGYTEEQISGMVAGARAA